MNGATWEIRQGEVLASLREMPDESVQCCVTSPPYYGLRDYGTGKWEGGDPDCEHRAVGGRGSYSDPDGASIYRGATLGGASNRAHVQGAPHRGGTPSECTCGARRADDQIGLEPTPELYVERLVEVFREVRRILRTDGTCWLNLGDSYNAGRNGGHAGGERQASLARHAGIGRSGANVPGLKPKDLIGVPWMVAFALRADGWYLRRDIVWSKPNPMPESVKDRPTSAHEYVFMLSKSGSYFYDAAAIREEAIYGVPNSPGSIKSPHGQGFTERAERAKDKQRGHGRRHAGFNDRWDAMTKEEQAALGRNKRSVWTVATQPFPDAHFAVFPPKLIEPMILAGSAPQACGECGAPWRRILEREDHGHDGSKYGERAQIATGGAIGGGTAKSTLGSSNGRLTGTILTVGWEPTCGHTDGNGRSVILDPFAGAGTTVVVALRNGRSAVGIELNPDYVEMARERVRGDAPLFNVGAEIISPETAKRDAASDARASDVSVMLAPEPTTETSSHPGEVHSIQRRAAV